MPKFITKFKPVSIENQILKVLLENIWAKGYTTKIHGLHCGVMCAKKVATIRQAYKYVDTWEDDEFFICIFKNTKLLGWTKVVYGNTYDFISDYSLILETLIPKIIE